MIFNYPHGPILTPCNTGESCSWPELLHHWQTSAPWTMVPPQPVTSELCNWKGETHINLYFSIQYNLYVLTVIFIMSDCCIIGHLFLFHYIFIDFRYLQWLVEMTNHHGSNDIRINHIMMEVCLKICFMSSHMRTQFRMMMCRYLVSNILHSAASRVEYCWSISSVTTTEKNHCLLFIWIKTICSGLHITCLRSI